MFYVYAYIDPTTLQPFYVGKGKGDRKYHHLWNWRRHKNDLFKSSIQQLLEQGQRPIIRELFRSTNESDVLKEEVRLISMYGRIDIGTGILCNKTFGGDGFGNTGTKWSDTQRRKIESHNESNPRGRGVTQYTLTGEVLSTFNTPRDLRLAGFSSIQIMRIRKCCNAETFSAAGYRWSFVGEPLPTLHRGTEVQQVDTDTHQVLNTFISMGDAQRQTGVHANSISACINGKLCTAGGFIWKRIGDNDNVKSNTRNKPVQQINDRGEVTATFSSVLEAARHVGVDSTNISNVCKGKRLSSAGYFWKYV